MGEGLKGETEKHNKLSLLWKASVNPPGKLPPFLPDSYIPGNATLEILLFPYFYFLFKFGCQEIDS